MIDSGEMVLVRWPELKLTRPEAWPDIPATLKLKLVRPITEEAIRHRDIQTSPPDLTGAKEDFKDVFIPFVTDGVMIYLFLVNELDDTVQVGVQLNLRLQKDERRGKMNWIDLFGPRSSSFDELPANIRSSVLWALLEWLGISRYAIGLVDVAKSTLVSGNPVVDIELYQLMNEDPPPIWPQGEFLDWAKAVSS